MEEVTATMLGSVPRWWAHAACTDQPTDLFFADGRGRLAEAVRVCATCPVRRDCYQDARARGEEYGVWGGVVFHKMRGRSARVPISMEVPR